MQADNVQKQRKSNVVQLDQEAEMEIDWWAVNTIW